MADYEIGVIRRLKTLDRQVERLETQEPAPRSAMSVFLHLPALRGFWPLTNTLDGTKVFDLSGSGLDLDVGSGVTLSASGKASYADFATGYIQRTNETALQITGTESYVGNPGLTLGGWFYLDTLQLTQLIGKGSAYSLVYSSSSNGAYFALTSGSSNLTPLIPLSVSTWYFVAGRFTPSTEMKIWVNTATEVKTSSIPATLNGSNTNHLTIGKDSGGSSRYLDGRAACCFLCASAVPDEMILELYQASKVLFG